MESHNKHIMLLMVSFLVAVFAVSFVVNYPESGSNISNKVTTNAVFGASSNYFLFLMLLGVSAFIYMWYKQDFL